MNSLLSRALELQRMAHELMYLSLIHIQRALLGIKGSDLSTDLQMDERWTEELKKKADELGVKEGIYAVSYTHLVEWEGGNLYFPQWDYHMDIDYLNY